jgi:hypothetical protein
MSRRRSTSQAQLTTLRVLLDELGPVPFERRTTGPILTPGGLDPLGALAVLRGLVPLVDWQAQAWALHDTLGDLNPPHLKTTIHALECSRANRWAVSHHDELGLSQAVAQLVHDSSNAPGRTPEAVKIRELIAQLLLDSQNSGHGEDR